MTPGGHGTRALEVENGFTAASFTVPIRLSQPRLRSFPGGQISSGHCKEYSVTFLAHLWNVQRDIKPASNWTKPVRVSTCAYISMGHLVNLLFQLMLLATALVFKLGSKIHNTLYNADYSSGKARFISQSHVYMYAASFHCGPI